MNDNDYYQSANQNLNRWLVSRNYWYVYRNCVVDLYYCYYKRSKLLNELLYIYSNMSKDERNSYIEKNTQKAE